MHPIVVAAAAAAIVVVVPEERERHARTKASVQYTNTHVAKICVALSAFVAAAVPPCARLSGISN